MHDEARRIAANELASLRLRHGVGREQFFAYAFSLSTIRPLSRQRQQVRSGLPEIHITPRVDGTFLLDTASEEEKDGPCRAAPKG
jgi:hypothetical protein